MWDRYICNANESSVPMTFRASDGAIDQHNSEIFNLESRIRELETLNREAIETLIEISKVILKGNYAVCLDRTSDNIMKLEDQTGKSWAELQEQEK